MAAVGHAQLPAHFIYKRARGLHVAPLSSLCMMRISVSLSASGCRGVQSALAPPPSAPPPPPPVAAVTVTTATATATTARPHAPVSQPARPSRGPLPTPHPTLPGRCVVAEVVMEAPAPEPEEPVYVRELLPGVTAKGLGL